MADGGYDPSFDPCYSDDEDIMDIIQRSQKMSINDDSGPGYLSFDIDDYDTDTEMEKHETQSRWKRLRERQELNERQERQARKEKEESFLQSIGARPKSPSRSRQPVDKENIAPEKVDLMLVSRAARHSLIRRGRSSSSHRGPPPDKPERVSSLTRHSRDSSSERQYGVGARPKTSGSFSSSHSPPPQPTRVAPPPPRVSHSSSSLSSRSVSPERFRSSSPPPKPPRSGSFLSTFSVSPERFRSSSPPPKPSRSGSSLSTFSVSQERVRSSSPPPLPPRSRPSSSRVSVSPERVRSSSPPPLPPRSRSSSSSASVSPERVRSSSPTSRRSPSPSRRAPSPPQSRRLPDIPPSWAKYKAPSLTHKIRSHDRLQKKKFKDSRIKREHRVEVQQGSTPPQMVGPPNFVKQMIQKVEQIQTIILKMHMITHQVSAYQRVVAMIQLYKEFRNLYNRCMIMEWPSIRMTAEDGMRRCQRLLSDENVHLNTIQMFVLDLLDLNNYLMTLMRPWRDLYNRDEHARRETERYERRLQRQQTQERLQTARNTMRQQDPYGPEFRKL